MHLTPHAKKKVASVVKRLYPNACCHHQHLPVLYSMVTQNCRLAHFFLIFFFFYFLLYFLLILIETQTNSITFHLHLLLNLDMRRKSMLWWRGKRPNFYQNNLYPEELHHMQMLCLFATKKNILWIDCVPFFKNGKWICICIELVTSILFYSKLSFKLFIYLRKSLWGRYHILNIRLSEEHNTLMHSDFPLSWQQRLISLYANVL